MRSMPGAKRAAKTGLEIRRRAAQVNGLARVAECQPLTEDGPVWNYLVGQRKIAPEVLKWFDVREVTSKGQWVMVLPYFAVVADDEQVNILGKTATPEWLKFEALERVGGKKREWTSKGPEKALWGMQLAARSEFKDARAAVICEGEKDSPTWASYGCHKWGVLPVSVPFGEKWNSVAYSPSATPPAQFQVLP